MTHTKAAQAVENHERGYNCAQAVALSHCGELGLDEAAAVRLAAGFGGGMGHSGEVCGAVSGAVMLIGLKYGEGSPPDGETKKRVYQKVKDFITAFKNEFGPSISCPALLKSQPGVKICPHLVRRAVELLEGMLGNKDLS